MPLGKTGALAVSSVLLLGTLAACSTTARVSDVYMALDADGNRKRNTFFTDTKEIHCVVEMGIGREGVTIEAIVRQLQSYDFEADRFFETDRVLANAEQSPRKGDGIQKLDVSLNASGPNGEMEDDAPFPPGRYQCEAYLDGELQRVSIFNIDFPDCPTATIVPKSLCYGFYKKGTTCLKFGDTSRDPAKCSCSPENGWEC